MRIATIIPTYNEEKHIFMCLKSLLHQTLQPTQVIVCDGGSTDNTIKIAAKMLDGNIKFQIVNAPRRPLLGKWNISTSYWRASQYLSKDLDLVACLEADVVLDENYYEAIARKFEESPRLGLAGGVMLPFGFPKCAFPLPRWWDDKLCWGGNRIYRFSCWLDLTRTVDLRLLPNWEDGHDVLAVLRGWRMARVKEAVSWGVRPPNPDRGTFKGLADRTYGYPAWWVLYKVLKTNDINRLIGYACMALWGEPPFPFKNIYRQAVISELRRRVKKLL